MIEQAIRLLPEIGRSLYFAIGRHPRLHGIPLGQVKTMSHLLHAEPCSVREFADGLGISMATASEALDRLVELDLVERTTDPGDRRRAIVALTPEARRIAAEVREVRRRQMRAVLERLDPAERPVFFRTLQALVEVLREEPEASCHRSETESERRRLRRARAGEPAGTPAR